MAFWLHFNYTKLKFYSPTYMRQRLTPYTGLDQYPIIIKVAVKDHFPGTLPNYSIDHH